MKLEEIFHGFDAEKQKIYEDFLVNNGVSQDVIKKTKEKISHWQKDDWLAHKAQADDVHVQLVAAIDNNLAPHDAAVQKLIQKHYQWTTNFWTPTRETYIGLSHLYASHPDFVKFYEKMHPKLLTFLMAAMKIYADNELT